MSSVPFFAISSAPPTSRGWLFAVPLALAAILLPHSIHFARAEAPLTPVAPVPQAAAERAPAADDMAAASQTGWRPAGLQTGLELHFAPSAALQHPRFIGT